MMGESNAETFLGPERPMICHAGLRLLNEAMVGSGISQQLVFFSVPFILEDHSKIVEIRINIFVQIYTI